MCTFLLLNGVLWDMGLVPCGICAPDQWSMSPWQPLLCLLSCGHVSATHLKTGHPLIRLRVTRRRIYGCPVFKWTKWFAVSWLKRWNARKIASVIATRLTCLFLTPDIQHLNLPSHLRRASKLSCFAQCSPALIDLQMNSNQTWSEMSNGHDEGSQSKPHLTYWQFGALCWNMHDCFASN